MIRKPLYPLFALVVVVPVALLSFFAVRTLDLENEALAARRARLIEERLEVAGAGLSPPAYRSLVRSCLPRRAAPM